MLCFRACTERTNFHHGVEVGIRIVYKGCSLCTGYFGCHVKLRKEEMKKTVGKRYPKKKIILKQESIPEEYVPTAP